MLLGFGIYQRQGSTILTWKEPTTDHDLAMSFQARSTVAAPLPGLLAEHSAITAARFGRAHSTAESTAPRTMGESVRWWVAALGCVVI